ncbi:putative asclepain protein [Helianthus anomalus]
MAASSVKSDEDRFEDWIKKYNKNYETEAEKKMRFKSFQINLRHIDAHLANKNLKTHTWGLTQYSDLTLDEFYREILKSPNGYSGGIIEDDDDDDDEGEVPGKRQRRGCK